MIAKPNRPAFIKDLIASHIFGLDTYRRLCGGSKTDIVIMIREMIANGEIEPGERIYNGQKGQPCKTYKVA